MAYLFGSNGENILESLAAQDQFSDQFEGGYFDDADSNFLGIAIGKKAKARKAAKRNDRQSARKYKLETERIRALQGQERPSVVKDVAKGLVSVAGSIFGGKSTEQPETFTEDLPNPQNNRGSYPAPPPAEKNNTVIYLVVGAVVLGAVIYFIKK